MTGVKVTGYAYPWDVLDDPRFLDRVRELGVDEVAVAVSYHSARAATPWSSVRTSVVARHAALYRPVRDEVWGKLRPAEADWAGGRDSAGDAVRQLGEVGIPAAAWLVLTHNSQLGTAFPEITVQNCFGERYPWALCPAQPAVREYAATLTAECLDRLEFSSVILEACGPLGVVHQHQHEKTDGVWSPATARLLSICCCDACAEGWAEAGKDPEKARGKLRAEVRRLIDSGDLRTTEDKILPTLRQVLLDTRQKATDALRREVLEKIPAGPRIVLHGAMDPWVTGALPGLTPSAPADVDAVVLQNWVPGPRSVEAVASARAKLPEKVAVGSYITAVGASPVPDIEAYTTELGRAGAAELHLYHLGLAGPGRWADLIAATSAAHEFV